jgi:predicted metal-dependent hydrolase
MNSRMPLVNSAGRDGETVFFLGQPCRLVVAHSVWKRVVRTGAVIQVSLSRETDAARVGALLDGWFLEQARQVLPEMFAEVLKQYGWRLQRPRVPPVMRDAAHPEGLRLTVRRMRSRWGSCSVEGRITLNADLVRMPRRLIDYVAVHELCHLVHHNHAPAFWFQVATCLPDWRQRRDELKAWKS